VKLASHLRCSRHGIYYFRLVLPPAIAVKAGQYEIQHSLGTRCPKEAKMIGYQIWAYLGERIQIMERYMANNPINIDPKDVKKLLIQGLSVRPDGAFTVEKLVTSDDPVVATKEIELFSKMVAIQASPENVEKRAKQLQDEERRGREREILENILIPKGIKPERASTLQDAWNAYMLTKKGIAASTAKSYNESFDLFCVMVGGRDRNTSEVTDGELLDFNEALAKVPKHAKKLGLPLSKASAMLKAPVPNLKGTTTPAETISAGTCNAHCINISGFLDYLINSKRRNGPNPLLSSQRHSDGEEEGGAEAFTDEDLKRIFEPKAFTEVFCKAGESGTGKRGRNTERPHLYWGTLLALYTGARANEIACLDVGDFTQEKGAPCISIRHTPRRKPDAIQHVASSFKRTKNESSRRTIPLHPDLFKLGLQDYLDDLKAIGATRFFPHLPMDSRDKRDRYLSRDINAYLKDVGVHVPRTKVLHSFRDTVSDLLGVSDLDEVRADQWTGHKNQSVKGKHYRSKASADIQARDGFKAFNFDFIDFERLRYPKGCWNEWLIRNFEP